MSNSNNMQAAGNQPVEPIRRWMPGLRELTSARLGIGRAGGSLKTAEVLDFDLAHARARDAVHDLWDVDGFMGRVSEICAKQERPVLVMKLETAAGDRSVYLKRPDWGRRLSGESAARLEQAKAGLDNNGVVVIVSDGLSARAVESQALAVLEGWVNGAQAGAEKPRIGAVLVVPRGRVGLTDHVGEILGCGEAVILLGERPGLAAPGSMGIYYTYQPRLGKTDADRNCISNIHSEGLGLVQALGQLMGLVLAGRRYGVGGVALSTAIVEAGEEHARLGKDCEKL